LGYLSATVVVSTAEMYDRTQRRILCLLRASTSGSRVNISLSSNILYVFSQCLQHNKSIYACVEYCTGRTAYSVIGIRTSKMIDYWINTVVPRNTTPSPNTAISYTE